MSKFYIKWRKNQNTIPANPEEQAKLWMTLLEWVRADMKAGLFNDWGHAAMQHTATVLPKGMKYHCNPPS